MCLVPFSIFRTFRKPSYGLLDIYPALETIPEAGQLDHNHTTNNMREEVEVGVGVEEEEDYEGKRVEVKEGEKGMKSNGSTKVEDEVSLSNSPNTIRFANNNIIIVHIMHHKIYNDKQKYL